MDTNLTQEMFAKSIDFGYATCTHTMLITNCNNFELFGSSYCLVSIDLPSYEQPQSNTCIFSKSTNPRPYYTAFLFDAIE